MRQKERVKHCSHCFLGCSNDLRPVLHLVSQGEGTQGCNCTRLEARCSMQDRWFTICVPAHTHALVQMLQSTIRQKDDDLREEASGRMQMKDRVTQIVSLHDDKVTQMQSKHDREMETIRQQFVCRPARRVYLHLQERLRSAERSDCTAPTLRVLRPNPGFEGCTQLALGAKPQPPNTPKDPMVDNRWLETRPVLHWRAGKKSSKIGVMPRNTCIKHATSAGHGN